MTIIVQKYGGSSVADVPKLERVAQKVVTARAAGHDVVVVVSAMGKSTDQLLALAKQVTETPPRRELDMLLTTGERVSMALLAMAIQKRGHEAISFTGSQSGIITNDRHFDARIIEVKPHRIEDELARGRIVIVAGYQGMSYRREITTLGRGGSDTTAIALAAALGAERAEIYSDVDGVYTADPRVVPDARHIPSMTYDAMQEMAEVGAKVLNAAAVEFARKAKIAIHARSTFEPGRETVVCSDSDAASAVVGQRGIVRLHSSTGLLGRVESALAAAAVPCRDLEIRNGEASMTLATALTPEWPAVVRELAALEGTRLQTSLGCASVTGVEVTQSSTVLDVLARAGIRPEAVLGTSNRVSVLVDEVATDAAVRALHARFVEARS